MNTLKLLYNRFKDNYTAIWRNLFHYIDICQNNSELNSKTMIIKGEQVVSNPLLALNKMKEFISGNSSSYDKLPELSRFKGNDFHSAITNGWGDMKLKNKWNGPAISSNRIKNTSARAINLDDFPNEFHLFITNIFEVYNKLVHEEFTQEKQTNKVRL